MAILEDQKKAEEQILKFWENNKIPEKVRRMKKKKIFYFVDGPPYATGSIHMGTALNKILKDVYMRFFRMLSFKVWDQPGYDTHGLPIENKVEEMLGLKMKSDIEKFGIENFIEECRKFSTKFIDVMSEQFNNLGVWYDWKNPYLTLTNDYIESAWFTFKEALKKGLLFKGLYPVHVCPRCQTAVAYNEIEYKTVSDPSIYVKFKLKNRKNEYLVIWTTTPWTLPANTGVMVKPDAEYVRVKVNQEIWIVARELLETVMDKLDIESYNIVETLKGSNLDGWEYFHPLADLFPFQQDLKNAHRVVLSDQFVSLTDGTGLVHLAPGHGQEDYKVGLETGLPAVSPVKIDGSFDETCGKYAGIFVKEADGQILQELENRGLLLHQENITHEYPHCWRCDSSLLLISLPQWFFKVTEMRDKLIEENKKVNWCPPWAGQRFQNWLESLGDWPISRQRYWGIPLPIWICEECGEVKVVGSRDELEKIPKDFHRPYIDEVTLKCPKCKGRMKRVPDVLDVWFDSGVCSWASLGFPKNKELWKKMWPADLNLEGPDQIRGWWNSELITSVITFDRAPFKTIVFHGFVLDAHGIKMSKSKGNVIMPQDVINEYGRDVLRFYLLSSPAWDDFYFNMDNVKDVAKEFNIMRNTFNFVSTYVKKFKKTERLKIEDKWILSRLNSLIENYLEYFKSYQSHKAVGEIKDFILNDFSRWYIKLIRDRVWPLYKGKDKEVAFYTLVIVTENLAKLLAPICPFIAEDVYQNVVKKFKVGLKSVHMHEFPKPNKKMINKKLEEKMEIVKAIVEASLAARQKVNLKLRWPAKRLSIVTKDEKVKVVANSLKSVLLNASNAKALEVLSKEPKGNFAESEFDGNKVLIDLVEDKAMIEEAMYRELVRKIQAMRKENKFIVEDRIKLTIKSDFETEKSLKKFVGDLKKDVGASSVEIGKLEGEYYGELEFRGKKMMLKFSKVV
ncbi:MAG: isoleucine--tRNA ligase [Candidatus Aenigmarchaeota archaeon]|nr:isoleucine--tRNA ligase [Candidatus Aenigmarchaeota archaeon]